MTAMECIQEMGNPDFPGTIFNLQKKLAKHLAARDAGRVRDYLITIRAMYPDLESCPIDFDLLKKASEFLKSQGWVLHLAEDHQDRISQYVRRH